MNQPSFEEALYPHYSDALKYCITLAAQTTHTEAEDLLQDALLKALQKYAQLVDKDKFRPWFFKVITRTYLSKQRLKKWKRFVSLGDNDRHIPGVFDGFTATDKQQVLLEALCQLSHKQRTALLLFEIGGFSIAEIKQIQGDARISAVKSRLSRARSKMKQIIEGLDKGANRSKQPNLLSNLDEVIHETTKAGIEALNRR